ncbi:MAG: EAL domain-containing protein [Huintestinicola sp.]|uniref:EAL domain-containing protein n=1 Tax=Huintestinicola sp. TaxID=2981661 RepID=UPI003F078080
MDKRRPLIAVIVSEADRSFICEALNVIQKELFAADMDVAVFSTLLTRYEDISIENKLFDIVNYELMDGFIVFLQGLRGDGVQAYFAEKLGRLDKPIVYMDEFSQSENNTVYDYDEMAEKAVSHLSKVHGVKTAAYVDGHGNSDYFRCIRESFLAAMDRNGITAADGLVFYGKEREGDLSEIAEALINSGLPDAALCSSDHTAAALIGELSRRNVRIPEDIIVVGCCSGEPYKTSSLNISSVKRDPSKISANAARRIISAVKGVELIPYEGASSSFVNGFSCGCGHIDIPKLSDTAKREMMPYSPEGFDSTYNYMQEELISAPTFADFLWKLDWYTFYISGLKGFWLCLNDNIMHTSASLTEYTDKLDMPYFRINGAGSVDETRKFNRSEMLPFIFESRDEPSAFIFTPLHFNNVNFGYTVLSYGNSCEMFDRIFGKWMRYVACALEKQRRHIIYCDDTLNAQIRDPLTGLLNMRGFKRMMTEEFSRNKGGILRIISVDVDNLNGINKAYGYKEGDKVLQKVGVILNNCAGDGDICVRVSGDEFIIAGILDSENPADEVPVKLERNLESYNSSCSNEYGIHMFTSIVTAEFDSLELLDKLPYDAAYQRNLTKDNQNKKRLLHAPVTEEEFDPEERSYVGRMLNDNLLRYMFQPIVDAHTGEIFAYEALMRSGGELKLSPVAILNHASALGRLSDVEMLTLSNTFDFLYNHSNKFDNKMLFVNCIPSCMLSDEDFDVLYSKYGSVMDKIVIEFTEQTEASSEQLRMIVDRSRRMKFKIAIDDYGTGYSNISNLLTFMPHCVKIDRSLIMNIQGDKRKQHFTRNIIEYAHDNNFKVLAEGVETSEELAAVISMGVDLIQGYYTAKPSFELADAISPDVAEEIVRIYSRSSSTLSQKTYFTSDETESELKSLDLESYTEVFVSSGVYTLHGGNNYTSELVITIKDGIKCMLNLDNVNLRNETGDPCIKLGKGSSLTLNIMGDVSIYGAILVPETADLKIIGDGTFSVIQKSGRKFAIGNDLSHSFGNIGIYLDNRFDIKVGAEQCVAIGGGINNNGSVIDIRVKEMSLDVSGKQVLGIGCFYSMSNVKICSSLISVRLMSAAGIAIGGFGRGISTVISNSSVNIKAEGQNVSGIYAAYAEEGIIRISDCDMNMKFNGEHIHAVGFENGFGKIAAEDSSCEINMEGSSAFAVGSKDDNAGIELKKCKGSVYINSADPHMLSADRDKVIITDCDFTHYQVT